MPVPRLAITGLGLVTPLGHGAWPTFRALLAGRTLADRAAALPGPPAAIDPVALVRALGCVSIAQHVGDDPAVELAERAAREALAEAGADPHDLPCIVGLSKGAMHTLTAAAAHADERTARAVALGPTGYVAARLHERLGVELRGVSVAACASSLVALHRARLLLHQGAGPRRALVVSSEASLLPLFIHSYRRLRVLPPLTTAGYRARPLDRHRAGFMLAEVGVAVVLERLAPGAALPPGALELLDTAVAAEGFDIVRPAPAMPALTHVAGRLLAGRRVDVLHPHATGTQDHDAAELAVYEKVISDFGFRISDLAKPQSGESGLPAGLKNPKFEIRNPKSIIACPPAFYAVKGALGHGLGAAGLTALVIAALSARTRRLPPMPWLVDPIASRFALGPSAIRHLPSAISTTHAVFAAGFGGHVAGAVIRG